MPLRYQLNLLAQDAHWTTRALGKRSGVLSLETLEQVFQHLAHNFVLPVFHEIPGRTAK